MFTPIKTGFAALAVASVMALAQAPQQPQNLTPHQLKPNVYWLEGGGGNTGVIVGDKGVVIVDAKTTPAFGKMIIDEVAKITPKPITHVIETHSDGDHVNGLASFPAGLVIVAQETNKKEQEAALAKGGRGAPPADHQPTQVITKTKEAFTFDGEKVELYHWAPAHTGGDLVIYLPAERIVFGGDLIPVQGPDPAIHPDKSGSTEGWITTMHGVLKLNADQIVPGHGTVQTRAAVEARLKVTEAKRTKIVAMVKEGKSLDEIKAAMEDNSPPAPGVERRPASFLSFSELVYNEVKK
jgi:glyoxylase-like metal-dependent hydrolase (beta-lactamase superfamily II)